jgi:hypothetical protein
MDRAKKLEEKKTVAAGWSRVNFSSNCKVWEEPSKLEFQISKLKVCSFVTA